MALPSGGAIRNLDPGASPEAIRRSKGEGTMPVDEWENDWYPLIDATLRRRFPEIHKEARASSRIAASPRGRSTR